MALFQLCNDSSMSCLLVHKLPEKALVFTVL